MIPIKPTSKQVLPPAVVSPEVARLEALARYKILNSLPEEAYDDLTALATQLCNAPMALISFIDENRQWFKSTVGFTQTQTLRENAFCACAILQPDEVLIIPDARLDARFAHNPLVTGAPHWRFYAGAPLVTPDGHALGAICVLDTKPRTLSSAQVDALKALSRQVMAQLELRYRKHSEIQNDVAPRITPDILPITLQTQESLISSQCNDCEFNIAGKCVVQGFYHKAPCGYHSLDRNGNFVLINDTELSWLGYDREELLGENFTSILQPSQRATFIRNFALSPMRGFPLTQEITLQRKDGSTFPALLNISAVMDENGQMKQTYSSLTDLTESRSVLAALHESDERFKAFMENGPVVTFIKDEEGRYCYANRVLLQLIDKTPEQVIGWRDGDLWPREICQDLRANDQMVISQNRFVVTEETVLDAQGQPTYWLSYKFPLTTASGRRLMGGMAMEITQRKRNEQQLQEYQRQLEEAVTRLEEIAITDALTGLRNRGDFMARLNEEVARERRYGQPLSLLILDADNFKSYNDEFGHPAGDAVLRTIGDCLRACARPSDLAARYGGEEFAMILPNTSLEGAAAVGERIRQIIAEIESLERTVTVSVGVAKMGGAVTDAESLLTAADHALYRAKRSGKNCVRVAE